jgi:predicted flap endonuclease-1-like 5' DNA nuclease
MDQVLNWANRADLARIKGIGSEYADLLEAAGVDTVRELAQRNPANLAPGLAAVNEEKILVRQLPTESEVTEWVTEAKALPRALFY